MATEFPRTRRKFRNDWDEIKYLYHKLLYWFYRRHDQRRASRFCERLQKLLTKADPDHQAIRGEECWSLVCEVQGDLANAIKHRDNEIRLIKRLRGISLGRPEEDYVLKDYGITDLSDRLDLLAALHHEAGDLDRAIAILNESKNLCEAHGVRFDGKDVLRDFLTEKRLDAGRSTRAAAAKSQRRRLG